MKEIILMHEERFYGSYLSQILMDFASIWLILKLMESRGAPPGPRPDPSRRLATGPPVHRGPGKSLSGRHLSSSMGTKSFPLGQKGTVSGVLYLSNF